jgi:acyl-CoA synthetase (AMP-forming)/AMP-acid ligase II
MLGQVVKAIVVPEDGRALDVMAIKEHCRRNLASYKVPKFVEVTAALPRTSSGKVQRFKLTGESLAHGS